MYFFLIAGTFMVLTGAYILVRGRRSIEVPPVQLPEDAEGFLPTDFLDEIANRRRLYTIRSTTRGKARLDVVEEESEENGVVGTLTICVDPRGMIALKDGHHRLLYALDNDIRFLPVKIRQSKGIRSHGAHITEVLPLLLQNRRVLSETEMPEE